MVSNSTKINKANNHLSLNTKKTMTYDAGNPRHGLEQTQTCGGIKSVMIFQPLP